MESLSGASPPDTPTRGQVLLVAAFGMAVVLVVLAMLLNTAIYASALASQGTDATLDRDVTHYRFEAVETARRSIVDVNQHDGASYSELHDTIETTVGDWSHLAALQSANGGVGSNVTIRPQDGTRIVQTNETRPMTNRNGDGSWILVANTDATRAVRLHVLQSSLLDTTDENVTVESAFQMKVGDSNGWWRTFIHRNESGDVLVTVEDDEGNRRLSCAASPTDGYVVVDVDNASVGGQDCPPLDFLDSLGESYQVEYVNGKRAVGKYSLVTNRTVDAVDDDDFGPDGSSSAPFATPAVYSATVTVAYATPRLQYETDVSVVPGENDA